MLHWDGLRQLEDGSTIIFLCPDCHSSLTHEKVLRFALKNDLYHGRLPEEFMDLTWVEEMVCSLYRNMAHVTRFRAFHGNTCAHDMNVISIADTLPQTPADLHGMVSVVFVGRGKLDIKKLGPLFHIRKSNVWRFLCWLSTNNILYHNMPIDRKIMDLYADDGILPGLEATIIHDDESILRRHRG
ncbi:hypothetical protein JB92DRAFT_3083549 [Gautieria morchelliformis]|nr:hypothetical protein JB92DRAFT_3083549 [Gautieria morchelliformis]